MLLSLSIHKSYKLFSLKVNILFEHFFLITLDLESLSSLDVPTTPQTTPNVLTDQQTVEASGKVAEIERRVDEMAERASLRRKLTPAITNRGSNESLNAFFDQSAVGYQPPSHSPSDSSTSGEIQQRVAVIGSPKPKPALISSFSAQNNTKLPVIGSPLCTSASSCNALSTPSVYGLPPASRCHWLSQSDIPACTRAGKKCKLCLSNTQ